MQTKNRWSIPLGQLLTAMALTALAALLPINAIAQTTPDDDDFLLTLLPLLIPTCGVPTITSLAPGQPLYAGQTVTLSVVCAHAPPSYVWRLNGVAIAGATTATVTITVPSGITTAIFSVTANGTAPYRAGISKPITVIARANQTITFGAQAAKTFIQQGSFLLDPLATASSGLAVTYSSSSTSVCTNAGPLVTMVNVGACAIVANQAGDSSYNPATPVGQTISIGNTPPPSQTLTFTWEYDANGHVNKLTYPSGTGSLAVSYSPNALGEATEIRVDSTNAYASAITYHPNGAVAGFTYGNGIVHGQTLNARQLPHLRSDIKASPAINVLYDTYTYDQNGNITGISDAVGAPSRTRAMEYDHLDRLKIANGMWGSGSYTYDSLDNIRSSTLGNTTTTRTYSAVTNRLDSVSSLPSPNIGYDSQGNVNARNGFTFDFDIANRLRSTTDATSNITHHAYDGLGRRTWVRPLSGISRMHAYSQAGQLLFGKEINGSSTTTSRYLYLGTRLIAEVKDVNGGTLVAEYVHTDGLGSPVARSTASGAMTLQANYEPYGNSASVGNNVGFTGHWNDATSGLVYMQQRYYDPVAGRFLSMDPKLTDIGTGGNFNRYAYVNNNPYRHVDPDGRSPIDIIFLAADIVNTAHAIYTGNGIADAAVGLGMSVVGVLSPIPGVGQALKGVSAASHVASATNKVGHAAEAANATAKVGEGTVAAKAVEKSAPDFIVSPGGTAFPVPAGANATPTAVINDAGKMTGSAFTGAQGGANGKVTTMRIMDANPSNSSGYIKYENSAKPTAQGVDPYTGHTVSSTKAHIPIDR